MSNIFCIFEDTDLATLAHLEFTSARRNILCFEIFLAEVGRCPIHSLLPNPIL